MSYLYIKSQLAPYSLRARAVPSTRGYLTLPGPKNILHSLFWRRTASSINFDTSQKSLFYSDFLLILAIKSLPIIVLFASHLRVEDQDSGTFVCFIIEITMARLSTLELEACKAKSHRFKDTLNTYRYREALYLVIPYRIQHALDLFTLDELKMNILEHGCRLLASV